MPGPDFAGRARPWLGALLLAAIAIALVLVFAAGRWRAAPAEDEAAGAGLASVAEGLPGIDAPPPGSADATIGPEPAGPSAPAGALGADPSPEERDRSRAADLAARGGDDPARLATEVPPLATALSADRRGRVLRADGAPLASPGASSPNPPLGAAPPAGADPPAGAVPTEAGGYAPPDAPIPGLPAARDLALPNAGDPAWPWATAAPSTSAPGQAPGTPGASDPTPPPVSVPSPSPDPGPSPSPQGPQPATDLGPAAGAGPAALSSEPPDGVPNAAGGDAAGSEAAAASSATPGAIAAAESVAPGGSFGPAALGGTSAGADPGVATIPRGLALSMAALSVSLAGLGLLFGRRARARARRRRRQTERGW